MQCAWCACVCVSGLRCCAGGGGGGRMLSSPVGPSLKLSITPNAGSAPCATTSTAAEHSLEPTTTHNHVESCASGRSEDYPSAYQQAAESGGELIQGSDHVTGVVAVWHVDEAPCGVTGVSGLFAPLFAAQSSTLVSCRAYDSTPSTRIILLWYRAFDA